MLYLPELAIISSRCLKSGLSVTDNPIISYFAIQGKR
jgi:hypothetical protein